MFYVILWILFAVIGVLIGKGKGRAGAGFALGFFLGPIGLIIIAVMKPNVEREDGFCHGNTGQKCIVTRIGGYSGAERYTDV